MHERRKDLGKMLRQEMLAFQPAMLFIPGCGRECNCKTTACKSDAAPTSLLPPALDLSARCPVLVGLGLPSASGGSANAHARHFATDVGEMPHESKPSWTKQHEIQTPTTCCAGWPEKRTAYWSTGRPERGGTERKEPRKLIGSPAAHALANRAFADRALADRARSDLAELAGQNAHLAAGTALCGPACWREAARPPGATAWISPAVEKNVSWHGTNTFDTRIGASWALDLGLVALDKQISAAFVEACSSLRNDKVEERSVRPYRSKVNRKSPGVLVQCSRTMVAGVRPFSCLRRGC